MIKMYKKLKHIIIMTFLLGIGLEILGYLKFGKNEYLSDLGISFIFTGIIILYLTLPRNFKIKSPFLSFSVLVVSLMNFVFISFFNFTHFSNIEILKIRNEYFNLTCEEVLSKFEIDKKNQEIKYFHFNMFNVESLEEKLGKAGVEYHFMGCLVHESLECYNNLVMEYLKSEHNLEH